jgi:hypothetical protein
VAQAGQPAQHIHQTSHMSFAVQPAGLAGASPVQQQARSTVRAAHTCKTGWFGMLSSHDGMHNVQAFALFFSWTHCADHHKHSVRRIHVQLLVD